MLRIDKNKERPGEDTAVAIGTFDGMHRGHQQILWRLKQAASRQGLATAVYTFSGIPGAVLGKKTGALFTKSEKQAAFAAQGIDYLWMQKFTRELADMPAEAFVDFLLSALRARVIVVGYNNTFGKDARGTPRFLQEYAGARGAKVYIEKPVEWEGEPVSSTRIRELLLHGDPARAAQLLGEPYAFHARVEHGKRLGRTIGFPTVNFYVPEGKLCPKRGVYISSVEYRGRKYAGITNIGMRPTVDDGDTVNIESHMIGFAGDIYGEEVCVRLFQYLRGEVKFQNVEGLRHQLSEDREGALSFFQKGKSMR